MAPYLAEGLPKGEPTDDGVDEPFWEGLGHDRLMIQRCRTCRGWQWGPEWICHRCLSEDLGWEEATTRGIVYSWTRSWHAFHPALQQQGPYIIVLVELPDAGGVRLIGNLLGDPLQEVSIGTPVFGVFERHFDVTPNFTLLQWSRA